MHGLDGLTVDEVLEVPGDYAFELGITRAVSLLRLRGMTGMLDRTKRQVREQDRLRAIDGGGADA